MRTATAAMPGLFAAMILVAIAPWPASAETGLSGSSGSSEREPREADRTEPADRIERRRGLSVLEGRIVAMDETAITIRSAETRATHTVRWDLVRTVRTERSEPRLEQWLDLGERLWRARTRLERGDVLLAEPLLQELFDEWRGRTDEAALIAAEGLLRCRLARGDQAGGVLPALEVIRLSRADVSTDAYRAMPRIVDDRREVIPGLPPRWLAAPGDLVLVGELGSYDARGDQVVAEMAALYRVLAARQVGRELDEQERRRSREAVDHPGLELLRAMVEADDPDRDRREAARQWIERELPDAEGWREAWLRFQLGHTWVNEEGTGRRQRGMVQLLHLPARFSGTQPYLSGLAVEQARTTAAALGMDELAERLREQMERDFTHHPVRQQGRRDEVLSRAEAR